MKIGEYRKVIGMVVALVAAAFVLLRFTLVRSIDAAMTLSSLRKELSIQSMSADGLGDREGGGDLPLPEGGASVIQNLLGLIGDNGCDVLSVKPELLTSYGKYEVRRVSISFTGLFRDQILAIDSICGALEEWQVMPECVFSVDSSGQSPGRVICSFMLNYVTVLTHGETSGV